MATKKEVIGAILSAAKTLAERSTRLSDSQYDTSGQHALNTTAAVLNLVNAFSALSHAVELPG